MINLNFTTELYHHTVYFKERSCPFEKLQPKTVLNDDVENGFG